MHRDLKAEATQPPSANLRAQQRRFQRWVHTYNHERPHEALGMQRPAEVYHPSQKRMGENVKMRYPKNYLVKTISTSGFLSFEAKSYHVGEHFAGCRMGLCEDDHGTIQLHYANLHLGNLRFDSDGGRYRPTAYIGPPNRKSLDKSNLKCNRCVRFICNLCVRRTVYVSVVPGRGQYLIFDILDTFFILVDAIEIRRPKLREGRRDQTSYFGLGRKGELRLRRRQRARQVGPDGPVIAARCPRHWATEGKVASE